MSKELHAVIWDPKGTVASRAVDFGIGPIKKIFLEGFVDGNPKADERLAEIRNTHRFGENPYKVIYAWSKQSKVK